MTIQSIGNLGGVTTAFTSQPDASAITRTPVQASSGSEQAPVQQTSQTPPKPEQLKDAVKTMNDFVGGINSSLQFSVDDKSGQTIVKVMDVDTKEVIKQIPSEEMLSIAKAVDKLKGLLVQQKA